jgi:DNA-binding response OmpR family regulator
MQQLGNTVLVVDDEPELCKMLGMFLKKCGFVAQEAGDGNQALALLQQGMPDAIVLDAMLPGVHGFDICYRVKNAEATRHIPVIMISAVYRGWRYADDVRRLYGADAFLEKPLRLDELKHTLDRCLRDKGAPADPEELSAKANAALQRAAAAYRQGDLPGSAQALEAAIAASPFVASLHHRLGLLYDRLNDPYRAIAALERAVELKPGFQYVFDLAQVYEKVGFGAKAYESWERALRLCSDPAQRDQIRARLQKLLP